MVETLTLISKGLFSVIKPTSNWLGRKIIGDKIIERRQLELTALEPILKQATEQVADTIEETGVVEINDAYFFLESSRTASIVRKIYTASILDRKEQDLEQIEQLFLRSFSISTGIPKAQLADSASRIFNILVEGCEKALTLAIDRGKLSAHEAKSSFRNQIILDELKNIKKCLELLNNLNKVDIDRIFKFVETYLQQVIQLHGKITPPYFDSEKEIPLDQIYVLPNFTQESSNKESSKHILIKQDFYQIIVRTVLLGNPGNGKSTFAQKLAYDLAKNYSNRLICDRETVPILLILRDYGAEKKKSNCSLLEFIELTVKIKYQVKPPDGAFEYLLLNGYITVIFDGLDELIEVSYRQIIRNDIELFCNLYPNIPVLITSRKIGYQEAPLNYCNFSVSYLSEFNKEQIREYVTKWFSIDKKLSDSEQTKRIETFLTESRDLTDIRSNPLMLGLMCNIYKCEGYIPSSRAELYAKCAEMMFDRWDRGIKNIELPDLVNSIQSKIRRLISYLAHWIYGDNVLESGVTEAKLINKVAEYLEENLFDDEDKAEEAATAFIRFCRGRAWVFTSIGKDKYGAELYQFTHRTFLEYFTAYYIDLNYRSLDKLCDYLIPKICKQESDLVCQLSIQIKNKKLDGAEDEILGYLIEQMKSFQNLEKVNLLRFLVKCLEFISPHNRILKEIIENVVNLCIKISSIHNTSDNSVENKFYIYSYTVKQQEILDQLTKAHFENISRIADITQKILIEKVNNSSDLELWLYLEIAYYLRVSFSPTTINHNFVMLDPFVSIIEKQASKDLIIAIIAVNSELISLPDFITLYGFESCFYQYNYRFIPDSIDCSSITYGLLYDLFFNITNPKYSAIESAVNSLSLLGNKFISANYPLSLDYNRIEIEDLDYLLSRNPIQIDTEQYYYSLMEKNPDALFGAFIIIAIYLKLDIERELSFFNDDDEPFKFSPRILNEIRNSEFSFFILFKDIFISRYQDGREFNSSVKLISKFNFTQPQKLFIQNWIENKIALIG